MRARRGEANSRCDDSPVLCDGSRTRPGSGILRK